MERSHLKQHHHQQQQQQQNNVVVSSTRFVKENDKNMKERWESCRNHDHQMNNGMFSWPPRSYTCSFCKREFRSAQALGGHMNVHRRDRARLRQLSPPPLPPPPPPTNTSRDPFIINLNINPNPNLDYSPDHPSTMSPLSSSSPVTSEIMKWSHINSDHNYKPNKGGNNLTKPLCRTNHHDLEKEDEKIIMTLDLKIGLQVRESEDDIDHQQDLDLELRLGYAHH